MKIWKKAVMAVVFVYAVTVVILGFNPSEKIYDHGMSVQMLSKRLNMLKTLKDPLQRDRLCIPLSGMCRSINMQLPEDARVYLPGMLGSENAGKLGYYFFMTYYLFPRDVDVSLNKDLDYVGGGYWTNAVEPKTESDLAANGYHLSFLFENDGRLSSKQYLPMAVRDPVTVKIFGSTDVLFAFLLPLVAAISGVWLINLLLPGLRKEIGPGEQFAGGLAAGCVVISFLVLALRLAGLKFERPLFLIMIVISSAGIVLYLKNHIPDKVSLRKKILRWEYLLLVPVLFVFYLLFSLAAGLESILEFDAIGAWALKAKILNHAAGRELLDWFSLKRLSHAHLEYPLMVPTLHAMTFGAVGHVNDFVLKYWNLWMLVALCVGTLSAFGWPSRNRFIAVAAITTVVFFPRTLQHVRMEGAVIPMLFFLGMGMVECALGLAQRNRDRFFFGLLFFFGALMAKPDGFVFLIFWVLAVVVTSYGRKMLKPDRRMIVMLALCVAAVLPFKYLRSQVPVLHPQADWLKSAKASPGVVIKNTPKAASVIVSRTFLSDKLTNWMSEDGTSLVYRGEWDGSRSLIQEYNLGFGWVVLFLGAMILVKGKGVRYAGISVLAILFGYEILLGFVYCSFPDGINHLQRAVEMSGSSTGGRYIFPLAAAVGTALLALIFREEEIEDTINAAD